MLSSKCQKYMNKYQERNYAPKDRKLEKNHITQHSDRSKSWKACETSSSDCIQQSREEQKEIIIQSHDNCVQLTEEVISLLGEENGNMRRDREEQSTRDDEVSESVMVMQDIPEKPIRRRRKKRSVKKSDNGLQKQKGD